MGILSTIALGLAINIASDKLNNAAEYFNIYKCSRIVNNEIKEAFEQALGEWSKSDVQFRTQEKLRELIFNYHHLIIDNNFNELPNEFKEFFRLFNYAIADKSAAYNYLSSKNIESLFLKLFDNQKTSYEKLEGIENKTDEIKTELKEFRLETKSNFEKLSARSEFNILFDKADTKNDKTDFIPGIKEEQFYFMRKIRHSSPKEIVEYFNSEVNYDETTLIQQIIQTDNSLLILEGEPGIGKSIELRMLAFSTWEDDSIDIIPYYRNLRNFTSLNTIESFLQAEKTETYLNVVYILDGIDEIKDVGDFISKFNIYYLNRKNKTSRFVLSCRSNILKKLKNEIEGGKIYKLTQITEDQSVDLFKKLIKTQLCPTEEQNFRKSFVIGDPFLIKLMASIYDNKGIIENNENNLWLHFINITLDNDEIKFVRKEFSSSQVLADSKNSAIIHTLMNDLLLKRENLFKISGNDKNRLDHFTTSSLIHTEENIKELYFKHRKIQECLTAMFLSELSIEKIMSICRVSGKNIIKPQIENTILFLISCLAENSKIKSLLDEIKSNNIEIIFKADLNLFTQDQRSELFKDYFTKQCIEKTLWLGTHSSITDFDLASFADSEQTVQFLIETIENEELNRRARLSALNVLEHCSKFDNNKLIHTINKLLNSTNDISFGSSVLKLVKLLDEKARVKLLLEVLKQFKEESNKKWNRAILSVLSTIDELDSFSEYIKQEFLWAYNFEKRKDDDKVERGNAWAINDLLLKLKSDKLFLETAHYFFSSAKSILPDFFHDKFIEKCVLFNSSNEDFSNDLFQFVKDATHAHSYQNNKLLSKFINATKLNLKAFQFFYSTRFKDDFDSQFYANISTHATIVYIANNFEKDEHNLFRIKSFRNLLVTYSNIELAKQLEEEFDKIGYPLLPKLPSDEEKEVYLEKLKDEKQKNFEHIFDFQRLEKKVEQLFLKNKYDRITFVDVRNFERKFYDEDPNNWHKPLPIEFVFLLQASFSKEEISFEEFKTKFVNTKRLHLKVLKSMLESNKDSNVSFSIHDSLSKIQQWVTEESSKFNFDDLVVFNSISGFSIQRNEDYKFLKILYYFYEMDEFKGCFDQHFLLESLVFYQFEDADPFSSKFKELTNRIEDKKELERRVIYNIQKPVFSFPLERLMVYALEENLPDLEVQIEKNMLLSKHWASDKLFQFYLKKTRNYKILEQLSVNLSDQSGWSALYELAKIQQKRTLCISKCLEYLKTNKIDFRANAIKVLLRLNCFEVIDYIIEDIDQNVLNNIPQDAKNDFYLPFDVLLSKVKELLSKIYETKKESENADWELSTNHHFVKQLIDNSLSKSENKVVDYDRLQNQLSEMLENSQGDDRIVFYINLLKETATISYINLMSEPLSFDDAFRLVSSLQ